MVNVGKYTIHGWHGSWRNLMFTKFTITGGWWNLKIYPKHANTETGSRCLGKKHTASKRLVNSYLYVFGGRWTKKHLQKEKHVLWHWLGSGFKYFLFSPLTYGNDPIWLGHIFQMDSNGWFSPPPRVGSLDPPTGHRAIGLPLKEMALALAERMEGLQLHRDVFTYSALISACVPWLATGSCRCGARLVGSW